MGGKGVSGAKSNIQQNSTALQGLAQNQSNESNSLFNAAFPSYQTANSFYQTLASGDPTAIARAIAPATQQINQASTGARQNILNTDPSGGEKNLALEQTQANQGAQVGQTASQGYLNSFNALGQLAGQGVGESQTGAGTAIGGLGAANQGQSQVANLGMQQKGQTLGSIGALAGDATSLGTAGISSK